MIIFKAYIENAGTDVLADWYANHTGKDWWPLWAKYYAICHHLKQQPVRGWMVGSGAYFHLLKDKVGRIGFSYNHIAYRHLGFFGPGPDDFSIVFTAEEHDHVYRPKGCIDRSVERMKQIKANPSLVRIATIQAPKKNV